MTYTITTRRPAQRTRMAGPPMPSYGQPRPTRHTVATLEEAWDKLPPSIAATTLARERFALDERGRCRIGPLPNGTVIEIKRST